MYSFPAGLGLSKHERNMAVAKHGIPLLLIPLCVLYAHTALVVTYVCYHWHMFFCFAVTAIIEITNNPHWKANALTPPFFLQTPSC